MIDRKKLFPRMTKTELLLLQTKQKGLRQIHSYFISIREYDEPQSVEDRRRKKFLNKQKYLKERGISGF